jgi:hypothetical protein
LPVHRSFWVASASLPPSSWRSSSPSRCRETHARAAAESASCAPSSAPADDVAAAPPPPLCTPLIASVVSTARAITKHPRMMWRRRRWCRGDSVESVPVSVRYPAVLRGIAACGAVRGDPLVHAALPAV